MKSNAPCGAAGDLEHSAVRFEDSPARMQLPRPLRRVVWQRERRIVDLDSETLIRAASRDNHHITAAAAVFRRVVQNGGDDLFDLPAIDIDERQSRRLFEPDDVDRSVID